jgi:hypothetical protein
VSARDSIENLWDRATPVAPLLDAYRADILREGGEEADRLRGERDMYASAIRQLIIQIKQTAYVWSQTMPDTLPTAEVVRALGLLAPRPLPAGLRDDLWQRIVAAYYLRFENDGHPEDAQAAADEAMAIVQPELDRLRAELEQAQKTVPSETEAGQ